MVRIREIKGEFSTQQEADDTTPIDTILEKNILPAEGYRGEYIKDIANALLNEPKKSSQIETLLKEKNNRELAELCSIWTVEHNLDWQRKDLDSFGVEFDNYFRERTLHESDKVLAVMKDLERAGKIFEEDGKKYFDLRNTETTRIGSWFETTEDRRIYSRISLIIGIKSNVDTIESTISGDRIIMVISRDFPERYKLLDIKRKILK